MRDWKKFLERLKEFLFLQCRSIWVGICINYRNYNREKHYLDESAVLNTPRSRRITSRFATPNRPLKCETDQSHQFVFLALSKDYYYENLMTADFPEHSDDSDQDFDPALNSGYTSDDSSDTSSVVQEFSTDESESESDSNSEFALSPVGSSWQRNPESDSDQ